MIAHPNMGGLFCMSAVCLRYYTESRAAGGLCFDDEVQVVRHICRGCQRYGAMQ